MKHFIYAFQELTELENILEQLAQQEEVKTSRSMLFQFYTSSLAQEFLAALRKRVLTAFPQAALLGTSASGEIVGDQLYNQSTALSVLCFASSTVQVAGFDCRTNTASVVSRQMQDFVAGCNQVRGVELLANVKGLDDLSYLAALDELPEAIPVFGGGADASGNGSFTYVFDHKREYNHGVVAAVFCGADLHIEQAASLGWKALGKTMQITKISNHAKTIDTIDKQPAVEVYEKYLKIANNSHFTDQVQVFPLLLQRHGLPAARVTVSSNAQGAITLGAKVKVGELVRLGYADPDALMEAVAASAHKLAAFGSQGILLFSCISRKEFLKEYADADARPFSKLAPVCGFYTFGEIFRLGKNTDILNCTLTCIGMREGAAQPLAAQQLDSEALEGHMSLVQRLVRFVEATTEELEAANRQLAVVATHDPLTHLLNRGEIEQRLCQALQRVNRKADRLGVIMLDIDNFKQVNDTRGHDVGDYVLIKVASALTTCIRQYDLVGRWGGEEFCLVLLGVDLQGAREIAERIRQTVAAMPFDKELQLTVSLGVSVARPGESLPTLYRRVDQALYEAKNTGKNKVVVK